MGRKRKGGLFKLATRQYERFTSRHGHQVSDILDFPFKLLFSPITLAFDFVGFASRGFGFPELLSKISCASVFVSQHLHLNTAVAALGTYDVALELSKKVLSQRHCATCNGWQALRCSMCRGSRMVQYQLKNLSLTSGQKATPDYIAGAIADNRAELLHLPSNMDLHVPLPSKDCPNCDGTGVMSCPECKHKLQVRISADDIMEPPWIAYNVLRKMEYPYEHIVDSMKDPNIASFWLFSLPQISGGFNYDDEVKQKIWWQYQESMRYDQIRDVVAKRKLGWEHFQEALISIDPDRAREDPVIVKNIPYYKAKKALEAEVMKLHAPPRPQNWGELDLPLNASSWSKEDLKNPEKFDEMTVLLNAQREIADKILDAQWETKWRQEKVNEMLEEKVRPFVQEINNGVLCPPIVLESQNRDKEEIDEEA